MLAQEFLIVVRAILAAAVSVMNAAPGWLPEGYGHLQSTDGQIAFHPAADRPPDNVPGMQVQNHSQIQPAFLGPDVADVARPLLVKAVC